jgi:excisionase family DNA binding protein
MAPVQRSAGPAIGRASLDIPSAEGSTYGGRPSISFVNAAHADDRTIPPPASDQDPVWLSVAQLCLRWQLDRKTIYKFIKSEVLPAWRVGRHLYRIAMADVLRFEARNKLPPS